MWLHINYRSDDSLDWLEQHSGLDTVEREALLADDPRPRLLSTDRGLLLILRGINLNQGAQPEDMVSMRVWVESDRVLSLRYRRINAAKTLRADIERGHGPKRVGHFVVTLIDEVLDGVATVSDQIDDEVARLEEQVLSSESFAPRRALADLRRRAIALRRYLAPERDVLCRLEVERVPWLNAGDRQQLHEMANRLTRIIEDLEAARERAAVTQDELSSHLSEQTNKRLYVLSVVAAIFLPLGLLTGLLGANVGGMPLGTHPYGFLILSGVLVVLVGLEVLLFRVKGWL